MEGQKAHEKVLTLLITEKCKLKPQHCTTTYHQKAGRDVEEMNSPTFFVAV
jgi:hypothetical protein